MTFTADDINAEAAELDSAVESAKAAVHRGYASIAQSMGDSVYEHLRRLLADAVQSMREHATSLGAAHLVSELRDIVGAGAGNVSIDLGDKPARSDVSGYIDNAVDTARAMVAAAKEGQEADAFKRAAFHADTILESEATAAYQDAREAGEQSLLRMSDDATEALGFRVARTEADVRNAQHVQTRANDNIVVVGKRWDSRANACDKCRPAHGELRPLGLSFSLPGPGAHAKCQCVTTLWAIDIPKGRSMDTNKPQQRVEPLLRAFVALDETREVDDQARTIRGAIASDETEDSHGSIIKAAGWKLDRYNKNPILVWAHKTGGWDAPEPEDVLGTTATKIDGTKLVSDLSFLTEAENPKSERVFRMMTAKPKPALRGLSVGFVPLKYRWEKRDGQEGADEILIIDEAELVEISVVPIPSNPNTLANQMRAYAAAEPRRESACEHQTVNTTARGATVETQDAAKPQEGTPMTDANKTHQVESLPAALAAVLGCQDVDSAVRAIADKDLATKAAKDSSAVLEKRVAELETQVKSYKDAEEKAITDMVDGLIKAGREPESKRDALLVTAKAAPEAFRKLYPAQEEPPRKALLERIVAPVDAAKTDAPNMNDNPIELRVAELRKSGKSYMEAYNQALNEYERGKSA